MKKIITIFLLMLVLFSLTSCNNIKVLICSHNYEEVLVESNCKEHGYKIKRCTKCKDEIKLELPIGNHVFGEWQVSKQATCINDGERQHICKICGYKEIENIKGGEHQLKDINYISKPTCTEDGLQSGICIYCGENIESQVIPALGHDYEYTHEDSTCSKHGYDDALCSRCEDYIHNELPLLEHNFTEYSVVYNATDVTTGLKERSCKECSLVEQKIIPIIDYIDLRAINNSDLFNFNDTFTANNLDDVLKYVEVAILNYQPIVKFKVTFQILDLHDVTKYIINNCHIFPYHITASLFGKDLEIDLSYDSYGTNISSTTFPYVQYPSANNFAYTAKRNDTYDGFNVNNSSISMKVSSSEQLFYCLEHAGKPICDPGSPAEVIYAKAKDILRDICDDTMNDFQKIKAIHDYLIMNICYDNELLKLTSRVDVDLNSYRGFYLEGALLDGLAVCDGISKAFTVLANIEGIPAVQVSGYQTSNPDGVGHAWNKVFLDGEWYIIDCTSDGVIISNEYEILSYDYFLISDELMSRKYTATTFNNIKCEHIYDSFSKMIYDDGKSFEINSYTELLGALNYYKESYVPNITIELKITYCSGEEKINEVLKGFKSLGLYSMTYNYFIFDDNFVFVRG